MGGPRGAVARVNGRLDRISRSGRGRNRTTGARSPLRPGQVQRSAARADGPAQVLADLRSLCGGWPARDVARVRLVRLADYRQWLGVLLSGIPRRAGAWDASQHHKSGGKGGARGVARAEAVECREWR